MDSTLEASTLQEQSLVLMQDQQLLELEEGEIKEAAEVGSNVMGAMGCCTTLISIGFAAIYIWYSNQIPDTCNSSLESYFFWQGILSGFGGLTMANTFFAGKGMANAMGHQVLAEKYKAEHREAEGAEEQRLFEQAALQPSIMLCCVFFAQGPILIGSLILGVYGLMQAIKADNESCASGKLVFWVLSVLNLLSQLSQVARARENMQQLEAERLNQPADGAGAYTQAPTVDVPLPASNPPGNEEPICASNPTSNF